MIIINYPFCIFLSSLKEAYKMVDEAKGEKFSAEKRLADATGQVSKINCFYCQFLNLYTMYIVLHMMYYIIVLFSFLS